MTLDHEQTAWSGRGNGAARAEYDGAVIAFQPRASGALSSEGFTHDLGNLLQIVSSGIRVVESRIRQGRVLEAQALLAEVGASMSRANALAHGQRRPADSAPALSAPVRIDDLLFRLRTPMRWALGAGRTLRIAVAPDLPALRCAEAELENALLNLVINARDAMPGGGHVTIQASHLAGANPKRDGAVAIRISDTGHGMSEAVAARAFEPRFTTKAKAGGHGLGLAMVANFAGSMGGSAMIEETSPQGTTILLCLPCQMPKG